MFGFPTQSRNLYGKSDKNGKQEPNVISDRSLDYAIWAFSPGSEIPNEKQIHTACGFSSQIPSSRGIRYEDPLGKPVTMLRCGDVNCDTYFITENNQQSTEDCSCGRPLEALLNVSTKRLYDRQKS